MTQPAILVTDPLSEDGLSLLAEGGTVDISLGLKGDELARKLCDYDALVVRSETKVTAEVLKQTRRLKMIARAGAGVDNIDLTAATAQGIVVVNAPSGNTIAAAEHTVALMFALARNIVPAAQSLASGKWERSAFVGTELHGKTLGIVGLGKIGWTIAHIASHGIGMEVIAYDPLITTEKAAQSGATLVNLPDLFARADIITVHVPLSDKTRGLIGREALSATKRGVWILNVARGGIVDELALLEAMENGHVQKAALDVFATEPPDILNHPLIGHPNVLATPHLGASTSEAQLSVARDVAEQVVRFFQGESPRTPVNLPSLTPDESALYTPFRILAYRLGLLAQGLLLDRVDDWHCSYQGNIANGAHTSLLTDEFLCGSFDHPSDELITVVNARSIALDRGIIVGEERIFATESEHVAGSMTITCKTLLGCIAGSVINGQPRLTNLFGQQLDVPLEGMWLITQHHDEPGVVASVTALLAAHEINIAWMNVSRSDAHHDAIMVVSVDAPIAPTLTDQISNIPSIQSVYHLTLPGVALSGNAPRG